MSRIAGTHNPSGAPKSTLGV